MKIYLIGLPGSGKTTLGKALASSLNIPFVDMDAEIEKKEGCSISSIFAKEGEPYFRKLETIVLKDLANACGEMVISTGGGAPCFFDNLEIILSDGMCIYLKVSPTELVKRLGKSGLYSRPLLADSKELKKSIQKKMRQRAPFYSRSHHVLEGDALQLNDLLNVVKYGFS